MEECISKQHEIMFVSEEDGEITYLCVPCNKTHLQYSDCGNGR